MTEIDSLSLEDVIEYGHCPGRRPKKSSQQDKNAHLAQDKILEDLLDLRSEAKLIADKIIEINGRNSNLLISSVSCDPDDPQSVYTNVVKNPKLGLCQIFKEKIIKKSVWWSNVFSDGMENDGASSQGVGSVRYRLVCFSEGC